LARLLTTSNRPLPVRLFPFLTVVFFVVIGFPCGGWAQAQAGAAPEATDSLDTARVAEEQDQVKTDSGLVFAAISQAWLAGDHTALAEMVAPAGVQIAINRVPERDNHYSPDQAFYFFKNLFQSARTDSFRFSRFQDEPVGELVHAVAEWEYRRARADDSIAERLVFTLSRTPTGWELAGIRAIR